MIPHVFASGLDSLPYASTATARAAQPVTDHARYIDTEPGIVRAYAYGLEPAAVNGHTDEDTACDR